MPDEVLRTVHQGQREAGHRPRDRTVGGSDRADAPSGRNGGTSAEVLMGGPSIRCCVDVTAASCEDEAMFHVEHGDGGVSLWSSSSGDRCDGAAWLVGRAVAQHGVQDVAAAAREADQGGVVAFTFSSFAVVVRA